MARQLNKIVIQLRPTARQLMRCGFAFGLLGLLLLANALLPLTWNWPVTHGGRFTVHFFDVGQGDASLVQCGGEQSLIDGGPSRAVLRRLGRAMPFGDRHIEYVYLSHPHSDHIFGLHEVLERYQVDYLVLSEYARASPLSRSLLKLAQERGVQVVPAERGAVFPLGECGAFHVLWPTADGAAFAEQSRDYENDLSLVLELRVNDQSLALFTGDIGQSVEIELLNNNLGPTQLLKVAHHGSRYSSHYQFLRRLNPEQAIVQVGENNYGQPSQTILRRLEQSGATVQRTDRSGDVVVIFAEPPRLE